VKRRLEDLYIRGRQVTVDDGTGDPVDVWIQKLNPLEHEKAIRKAGAAKARVLMAMRDHDSEEYQEAYSDVLDLGPKASLVEYLVADESAKVKEAKEAELSFADEWKKDNYLQGLRDAWEDADDPLKDRYARNPEDEEAHRVFLELKRFADQVEAEVAPELERLKRDWADVSDEEAQDKTLERFVELRSGMAWLREFRRMEVFYSTRDPEDHRKYYFASRDQVDGLANEVFFQLSTACQELMVEPAEGKDSPKTPSSSPSSEPQNAVAT
jgi:hypothetical protein